jgi:large subunit ribosomal protein L25
VIVVAHDAPATANIFGMTKRIHDKMPEIMKPATSYSSKKELVFSALDSSYIVATAGGDGIGRSEMFTGAHLSEAAWWPQGSAEDNHAGLMDCIPNAPGMLVFEESTANSYNMFFQHWQAALKGESVFEAIFLSWLMADEYRAPVTEGFERTPDEEEIVKLYGATDEQLMFRRHKIAEKGADLFKQEFPLCAEEAFLTTGHPVFKPEAIAVCAIYGQRLRKFQCVQSLPGMTETPVSVGLPARVGSATWPAARRPGPARDLHEIPGARTMATVVTIEAETRASAGKGAARATRRAGKVPGVIYGAHASNTLIALDPRIVLRELHRPGWQSRVYELKMNGSSERALIRDVQYHPVTDAPEHIDFQRLAPGERIRVTVPVVFENEGLSTGLKRGGVLNVIRHTVEAYCDPENIPERFIADMTGLDFNDNVRWSSLKGTEGVRPVIADRDFVVATVAPPTKLAESTAEAAAATATPVATVAPAPAAAAAAPAAPAKAPARGAGRK